ncbi:MAG TPA: DUF4386 domain-containing protein [Candidatus Dormibacteraeota bacterium]|nr:DUF4386 domain-containing protein [Candidatus Dormibacteraeota bacterium]
MSTGVETDRVREAWPQLYARIAGGLYLIVIVGGIFAEIFVRGRLVVHGDAAATVQNIQAHELLYRLGFVVELFYCICNVPLIIILYRLFKVVNKNVALMMVFFGFITNAIESVSLLAHFAPLLLLGSGHHLIAFTAEQLQAASYLSLQMFEHGFAICLVFFGFDCFTMAYLIVHSKFFPRLIGVLLAIEGLGYLVNSFSLFLAPALQARIFPYFAATAIAEVALCLWLLVMGVNVQRWKEQAQAARGAL